MIVDIAGIAAIADAAGVTGVGVTVAGVAGVDIFFFETPSSFRFSNLKLKIVKCFFRFSFFVIYQKFERDGHL